MDAERTTGPKGATRWCLGLGDVAQLVEHLVCNQEVVGSNPIVSTSAGRSWGTSEFAGGCRRTKLFDKLGVR